MTVLTRFTKAAYLGASVMHYLRVNFDIDTLSSAWMNDYFYHASYQAIAWHTP